ncbi:hypothetical protein M9Y10_042171 [Tritrichomonas musculus]|uniref:Adenylate and Guanylate cyclase catalytic domain containing protein n=1 Tax=Tritrichomonas musculus TaxID=1915356 RepID=A0ABR2K6L3_9EUKA
MKTETQSGTANSFSFNSQSEQKYGGLLEKSQSKILRKQLSELISYVYSVSPPFETLHSVITVIRILQLIGPSLFPGYLEFWETDPIANKTLFVFSIFFYLIPPKCHPQASLPMIIIYIIMTAFSIILLLVCAKIFQKNANLPKLVPPFISIYFFSIGFILPPIACEILFSKFSNYIFETSKNEHVARTIILLVVSFILTIIYLFIFLTIALQVLTFQPMSLITVCTVPQNLIVITVLVINVLVSICEYAGHTITMVFCFIIAVCYFVSSLTVFYKGGLAKPVESKVYFASCLTGGTMCIIIGVMQILKKDASFILLAVFIALEVAFVFIAILMMKRVVIKRLNLIDQINDDIELFETRVKTVNNFINLAVTGFSELHPMCLNWSFMKMGIERWPNDADTWFIYAKFCAIYPEETQTLAWIFRSIITNKVKGQSARTVKLQSLSIARQREVNLSPDLKVKLNHISKHVTSAKHKLRNVWDMAIQGNISDMEMATKRAIKNIRSSDGELMHVIRLFPNNRFVTRQYARFCKELLADYDTCVEMIEKSRLLQRNINVNKDQTHEYGIIAFPLLPEKLNRSDQVTISQTTNNEMTGSVIDLEETEAENQEREESTVFTERIKNIKIPSTRGVRILSLVLYFVLFALPCIIILIVMPVFIDSLNAPLTYMRDISLSRTLMYQIIGFGLQTFIEKKGVFEKPNGTDPDILPKNFGSSLDTFQQLSYLCKEMTLALQKLDGFRAYRNSNSYMTLARADLFEPTLNYSFFSKTNATYKNINTISALSDIISQQRELITNNSISDDFVNTSAILNPSTSMTKIADKFNSALDNMVQYVSDNDKNIRKMITIIMYVAVVISAILFVIVMIVSIRWVQSNKEEAYRCLTAIPKNAVSQLAENLRILKKETDSTTNTTQNNSEMNKQEDNILKIFMTGGSAGSNSHDSVYIALLLALIMVLQIVSIVILLLTMSDISSNLRSNCPHLDYLQGMYANLIAAMTCITSLIGFNNPNTTIFNLDKDHLLNRINSRLSTTRFYYNKARYGGSAIDDPPFNAYQEYIEDADTKFYCENPLQLTTDFRNATVCFTADDIIILTEGIYRSYIIPYQFDEENHPVLPNDDKFRVIWDLLIYPVYDIFIAPMSEGIIETITDDMESLYKDKIYYIVILLVVGFLFECVLLFLIHSIEDHIHGVLSLLLHCPPKVLASSVKIMNVLDGNFSKNKGENAVRKAKYYEDIVNDLPDGVIVSDIEKNMITANKAINRLFGEKTIKELSNQPVTEFFSNSRFKGNISNLLNASLNKPITEILSFNSPDTGTVSSLEVTSTLINDCLCFCLRDTTQTIRYNTLIKEERQKSDSLLSSILPASLVPRVQAGEKNISFAVQSATIVFMDIVSFTPWCGSLPAEKVMSTLNLLFMKNDNLVAKYSTMTKIKCIGDCYMAAGGVFAEVNQPALHAKEVVNFGLDALDAIQDLNKELNETLKIRVGINTGGPIVAGVLGIGKPTFEILGPAINMAQQMEHHGVPSQVHVSRSVYELIYGDSYAIKERGQIEVKNGMVITYLVNRK